MKADKRPILPEKQ